jgi:hypothetical protein
VTTDLQQHYIVAVIATLLRRALFRGETSVSTVVLRPGLIRLL